MKSLILLSLSMFSFLPCKWQEIEKEELIVNPIFGMINSDPFEVVGACGGTESIDVEFKEILFCKRKSLLKIDCKIVTRRGREPLSLFGQMMIGSSGDFAVESRSTPIFADSTGSFQTEIKFDPKSLKEIVLGCKMSIGDRQEIRNLIESNLSHVKIYQAEMSTSSYKIKCFHIFCEGTIVFIYFSRNDSWCKRYGS